MSRADYFTQVDSARKLWDFHVRIINRTITNPNYERKVLKFDRFMEEIRSRSSQVRYGAVFFDYNDDAIWFFDTNPPAIYIFKLPEK